MKQNVHKKFLPRTLEELKSNALSILRSIQKRPHVVKSFFQTERTRYAA